MDIQFYHLLSTPLEKALPKLVAMAYAKGMRVCIVAQPSQHAMLDEVLWTYQKDSFLPHGLENEANAAFHPIIIASAPTRINAASLLILTDSSLYNADAEMQGFERVFDMFNGNDSGAVEQARVRWKTYADAQVPLAYIKQRNNGGWDKIKEVK